MSILSNAFEINPSVFVSACVSDCIGRESWAFGCFENTSLEMLSQERRGEERGLQRICSQISAPHSFHQQQLKDQNSVEIWHEVSEAKLGFSGVARIYASWRFSRGVDYSRWSQVWVLKPDPPGTHPSEPSCYQIFLTNLRALAKKVIDSLPFSIAPELITDTLWCAREQIWAEKNLWG